MKRSLPAKTSLLLLACTLLAASCSEPEATVTPKMTVALMTSPTSIPLTPTPDQGTATPETPAIDILRQDLATCPGFESLCINPHGFGLSGAELTTWQQLREKKDAEYEAAWKNVLVEKLSEGKWQAEFVSFFGTAAPDVAKWDSLTNQQQMDLVASYLRVYGDGLTAVNVPTSWMREAASSRELLFVKYNHNGNFTQVGYFGTFDTSSTTIYDQDPQFLSFGQLATIQWQARESKLGFIASDFINPINSPGKSITDVGLTWVYVRDQQGVPHATFILIPFATQDLGGADAYVHGTINGTSTISPGLPLISTAAVKLIRTPFGSNGDETVITTKTSRSLWEMLVFAREQPGMYWLFKNTSDAHVFIGGLDVDTTLNLIAPKGTVFPPLQ